MVISGSLSIRAELPKALSMRSQIRVAGDWLLHQVKAGPSIIESKIDETWRK